MAFLSLYISIFTWNDGNYVILFVSLTNTFTVRHQNTEKSFPAGTQLWFRVSRNADLTLNQRWFSMISPMQIQDMHVGHVKYQDEMYFTNLLKVWVSLLQTYVLKYKYKRTKKHERFHFLNWQFHNCSSKHCLIYFGAEHNYVLILFSRSTTCPCYSHFCYRLYFIQGRIWIVGSVLKSGDGLQENIIYM